MKPVFATLLLLMLGNIAANSATIAWTNTSGGNWSVATNWSPNQVPGASDTAVITASGIYTVTFNAGGSFATGRLIKILVPRRCFLRSSETLPTLG